MLCICTCTQATVETVNWSIGKFKKGNIIARDIKKSYSVDGPLTPFCFSANNIHRNDKHLNWT